MIEQHIDHYTEDEEGNRRSVHYPTAFVRHYMKRDDGALPTVVAIATSPIVLGDGELLAPDGLDRLRGIQFIIPDELRAVIPERDACTRERVKDAMGFLCDQWLCDVATDCIGKCIIIADALTLIERSLLSDRPCFFVTAGRRGGGKTTTLSMLVLAVTGVRPASAAWSSNEEERRKALMAYFLSGVDYIIWDNIPRGMQISCPHIERSCTAAYYSDRKLGVSETVCTAASTIHHFTGNNIRAKGELASRSLEIRLEVDRVDPENRMVKHSDPIGWTEDHRAEILEALYTVLLGNPQLKTPPDAPGKTRFKMWWRLVGSAVENAARLAGQDLDFRKLFLAQEDDDEESVSLAEVLEVMLRNWPKRFTANEVAKTINTVIQNEDIQTLRDFLQTGVPTNHVFSPKTIGKRLKDYIDGPVRSGERTLILRSKKEKHGKMNVYNVTTA